VNYRGWEHMSDEEKATLVPTSSMSFEKQVLILRAYVVLTRMGVEPIQYKRVVTATRLARTQISGVNSFFLGLGFLKKVEKGTYLPAKEVVEFYNEELGKENYSALKPLVAGSTLYRRVSGMIMIHGSATKEEIIEYLLEESGEKTGSRAGRALEWLEHAGLIAIGNSGDIRLL